MYSNIIMTEYCEALIFSRVEILILSRCSLKTWRQDHFPSGLTVAEKEKLKTSYQRQTEVTVGLSGGSARTHDCSLICLSWHDSRHDDNNYLDNILFLFPFSPIPPFYCELLKFLKIFYLQLCNIFNVSVVSSDLSRLLEISKQSQNVHLSYICFISVVLMFPVGLFVLLVTNWHRRYQWCSGPCTNIQYFFLVLCVHTASNCPEVIHFHCASVSSGVARLERFGVEQSQHIMKKENNFSYCSQLALERSWNIETAANETSKYRISMLSTVSSYDVDLGIQLIWMFSSMMSAGSLKGKRAHYTFVSLDFVTSGQKACRSFISLTQGHGIYMNRGYFME